MELQCPQCGKWMAVSLEELVTHDSQVVCPQCLAVCHYENNTLVVRDDSDAPYRHTATVDSNTKHDSSNYCHSCGKPLPAGISYCPYCGADLAAPFDKSDAPVQPAREPHPQPEREKPRPERVKAPPAASKPQSPAPNHVEEKLRTVSRHYTQVHPQLRQNGTMPGLAFKVVAYGIIAILLILLVLIIIAGSSLKPMG